MSDAQTIQSTTSKKITDKKVTFVNKNTISPINTNEKTLLSYYSNKNAYNEEEIFDSFYEQALKLMGGDRLLKTVSSINLVTIRKTTTDGLYKVILSGEGSEFSIKHIDEAELLNNRKYSAGTISKLGEDEYEITYFDSDDEIEIEHFNKQQTIDFMNKNKLVFQV